MLSWDIDEYGQGKRVGQCLWSYPTCVSHERWQEQPQTTLMHRFLRPRCYTPCSPSPLAALAALSAAVSGQIRLSARCASRLGCQYLRLARFSHL